MKTRKYLIMTLAVFAVSVNAAEVVVIGQALSNKYVEGIEIPCPQGSICMDGWFRWAIRVDQTISGPRVTGRVSAARMQHAEIVPAYRKRLRLFVLKPIEDPQQRALLHADWYLQDVSPKYEMFCLRRDPGEAGLSPEGIYLSSAPSSDLHCFEATKGRE